MENKYVKLKNRYHNDIVYCKDINDVVDKGEYVFYKVFTKENPNRIYLVNKEAFDIIKD